MTTEHKTPEVSTSVQTAFIPWSNTTKPLSEKLTRTAALRLRAFLVRLEWGTLTEDDPEAVALIRCLNLLGEHDPGRDPLPQALSMTETAEELGISRRSVYNMIESGELETVTIRRRRLVPVSELARLLVARPFEEV